MPIQDLIAELAKFVEKASRPGVLGLPGMRIEKACASDLQDYFDEVKAAIMALGLEHRTWDMGTARHVVEQALANALRKKRPLLQAAMELHYQDAFELATRMDHFAEAFIREYSDDEPRDETGKWTTGSFANAETGKEFTHELHRGEGATNARVASQFAVGTYWSPSSEMAGTYGPNVTSKIHTLKNPYVFTLGNKNPYYVDLKKEFGTKDPAAITKKLQAAGHDGLIVRNVNASRVSHVTGQRITDYKSVEVIVFDKKLKEAAPDYQDAFELATRMDHFAEAEIREWPDKTGYDDHGRGGSAGSKMVAGWTDSLSGEQMTPELKAAAEEVLSGDVKSEQGKALKSLMRQTQLKYKGQKTVTLYRGVGGTQVDAEHIAHGAEHDLSVDKLSAWTTDKEIAKVYADAEGPGYGRVMKAEVPVKQLAWDYQHKAYSNPKLEFGGQNEVVVLSNGKIKAKALHADLHEAAPDPNTPAGQVTKLGDTAKAAADWAAANAAELVRGIDSTTVDRLASVIEGAITDQLSAQGTGFLIRQELEDMSNSRALTIASTEINRAMSQATLQKLGKLEIQYKQWIPDADPCDICLDNVDDGAIPVDEEFSSGDMAPPAHPNCRCAIAGARGGE